MSQLRYPHLFFDLDHTLWDFETNARQSWTLLYDQFGLAGRGVCAFDQFFQRYSGHNERLWKRYTAGHLKQDELRWKRIWHTLLDDKIADEALCKELSVAFLADLPRRTQLFPHTHEVLTALQQKGYRLHMITNGFEEVQAQKLHHSELVGYFEAVVTSEGSGYKKPEAGIFEHALRQTGATEEQSLMIGDNVEADIEGATAAGWHTVFVNHVAHPHPVQAQFTITSLDQLLHFL